MSKEARTRTCDLGISLTIIIRLLLGCIIAGSAVATGDHDDHRPAPGDADGDDHRWAGERLVCTDWPRGRGWSCGASLWGTPASCRIRQERGSCGGGDAYWGEVVACMEFDPGPDRGRGEGDPGQDASGAWRIRGAEAGEDANGARRGLRQRMERGDGSIQRLYDRTDAEVRRRRCERLREVSGEDGGQSEGRYRGGRQPALVGGVPTLQLYSSPDATPQGGGWGCETRSVVELKIMDEVDAEAALQRSSNVDGRGRAPPDVLQRSQMVLACRCPLPGGGWQVQIRAAWKAKGGGGGPGLGRLTCVCQGCDFVADFQLCPIIIHREACCNQPVEPTRCGAHARVLRLLQTTPRGRCPHLGGGWPCWNRAPRWTRACGGHGGGGDARLGVVSIRKLQLDPPGKRDDGLDYIADGDQLDYTMTIGAVTDDFDENCTDDQAWDLFGYSVNVCDAGYVVRGVGKRETKDQYSWNVEILLGRVAVALLTLHCIAVVASETIAMLSRCPARDDHGDRAGGGRRTRPRRRPSREGNSWDTRLAVSNKRSYNLFKFGDSRVALAARVIAGRRYRRARRVNGGRALDLGPPWAPWRCADEAASWEQTWARVQSEVGRSHLGGPVSTADEWPGSGAGHGDSGAAIRADRGGADNIGATTRCGGKEYNRCKVKGGFTTVGRWAARTAVCAAIVIAIADCRIGEADNPGPTGSASGADTVTMEWQPMGDGAAAVVYPQPHRDGFRDVASPGFEQQRRGRSDQDGDEFTLSVESANTTGWGPLRRRLVDTDSDVLLAQETWVLPCQRREASDWATRHGWESVWAPAQVGSGGGASGGVAVFARKGLGLRLPTTGPHVVEEARAVAAFCEPPGFRPTLLVSAYLIDGKAMQSANKSILTKIGRCVEAQGDSCMAIVGGDFQSSPAEVDSSGFPQMMRGRVVTAPSARGTYRTARTATTIDFFVLSDELVDVVNEVKVVECSGLKGHSPVRISFLPRAVAQKALAVRQPPALTTERVYGPIPPPRPWEEVQLAADIALRKARTSDSEEDIQESIDCAYSLWCKVAEDEVADATGSEPLKRGLRGQRPRMRWRSVLPERAPRKGQPLAAIATWLKGTAVEMSRIVNLVDEEMGQGFYLDDPARRSYMPHGTTFAAPVRGGYDTQRRRTGTTRGGRPKPPADAEGMLKVIKEIRVDLGDEEGRIVDDEKVVDLWGQLVHLAGRAEKALVRTIAGGAHADLTLRTDIDSAIVDLAAVEKQQELDRAAAANKGWTEWLEEDWKRGAGRAHRATRNPVEWRPTTTVDARGVVTASPIALLESYRRKYKEFWEASDSPVRVRWKGKCQELTPLIPGELRAASMAFPKSTASTYDGWHVRHFALVSDQGLSTLSTLLAAVEKSAMWPTQVALTTMPLIGKPRGGHRTIGKLSALYRIWAKARRPLAAEWEVKNDRPFFAAAAGVGPIDAVYKQALRQEAACADGESAAVILDDMEAFYEGINREALLEEAQAVGFPTVIAKACLAAYATPRMLTLDGIAAREMYPRRGLIAGCTFATTLVKVFYVRKIDAAVGKLPEGANVDFYIDDVALSVEGPRWRVARDAITAHNIIRETLTEGLGCKLAAHKTAIVASHKAVGTKIAEALRHKEALTGVAANLGADTTAGKGRQWLRRGSRRKERQVAGAARRRRLRAVARAVGSKAIKIYVSGIAPGVTYGDEIWGASDVEVVRMRRVAAAALRPLSRCRSLTMAHRVNGMPTAKAEVKTAVQWAKAVWQATVRRERAQDRGMSLADIRRFWDSSYTKYAHLVDEYMESAETNGGKATAATARKAWGAVSGPVGAAAMTLARVGWRMDSAFVWRNRHGDEIVLTKTAPAMISYLLVEATKDLAERRAAAMWAREDSLFADRSACPDIVMRAVATRGGGHLSAKEVGALRAAACNGIFTRQRARAEGYDIDDVCVHCGAEGDSVHHRTFCCPYTRCAVLQHVPMWLYREGARASPKSRFWSSAVFPHPADIWPRPMEDFNAVVVGDCEGSAGLDGWQDPQTGFGGHLYTDGSCHHHPIRGLARAGSSAVQVNNAGERIRAAYLPVPRHLPQTSQAGENVGVGVARRMAARENHIKCDCHNVVAAANAPAAVALAHTKRYAGILLDRYTRSDQAAKNSRVTWVKAHRAQEDNLDEETARDIKGNAEADALAGEAVGLHPQPNAEQQAELDYYMARAPLVARALGIALAMFPPSETERLKRRAPARSEGEARRKNQHYWTFEAGKWRCAICHTWATGDELTSKQKAAICAGGIADAAADQWTAKGHALSRVEGPLPFVFCRKCGAWGSRRVRRLALKCGAPTPAGVLALRRIENGKHPWRRKLAGGGEAPRGTIVVTAAFDKAAKRWRRQRATEAASSTTAADTAATAGPPDEGERPGGGERPGEGDSQGQGGAMPVEAWNVQDGYDEDPFGHGGSLDQGGASETGVVQTEARANGQAPAAHSAEGNFRSDTTGRGELNGLASNGDIARDRATAAAERIRALRERIRGRPRGGGGSPSEAANGVPPEDASKEMGANACGHSVGGHGEAYPCRLRAPPVPSSPRRPQAARGDDAVVGVDRLRASQASEHRIDIHLHRLRGELRQHARHPVLGAVRGDHGELAGHDIWGTGSQCRSDPSTVPPLHQFDMVGEGLVNLEGGTPPGLPFRGIQEHRRRAVHAVEVVGNGPLVGRTRGANGDGAQGRGDRPRAREGVCEEETARADGERKRTRDVAGLDDGLATDGIAQPGSDVALPRAGGEACVYSSGAGQSVDREVGHTARENPGEHSEGAMPTDGSHHQRRLRLRGGHLGAPGRDGLAGAASAETAPVTDAMQTSIAGDIDFDYDAMHLDLNDDRPGTMRKRDAEQECTHAVESARRELPREAPRRGHRRAGEVGPAAEDGQGALRGGDAGVGVRGLRGGHRPLHDDPGERAEGQGDRLLAGRMAEQARGQKMWSDGDERHRDGSEEHQQDHEASPGRWLAGEPPGHAEGLDDDEDDAPRREDEAHHLRDDDGTNRNDHMDKMGKGDYQASSAAQLHRGTAGRRPWTGSDSGSQSRGSAHRTLASVVHEVANRHPGVGPSPHQAALGAPGEGDEEGGREGAAPAGESRRNSTWRPPGPIASRDQLRQWLRGLATPLGGGRLPPNGAEAIEISDARGAEEGARSFPGRRRHDRKRLREEAEEGEEQSDCPQARRMRVAEFQGQPTATTAPTTRAQLLRLLSGGALIQRAAERIEAKEVASAERPEQGPDARRRTVSEGTDIRRHRFHAAPLQSAQSPPRHRRHEPISDPERGEDRGCEVGRQGQQSGADRPGEPGWRPGAHLRDPVCNHHDERGLTHHHHHDQATHSVPEDEKHYHNARHQSSGGQFRPSHHVAELKSTDAHHIRRCYYGGRDSSPAIPRRTPNLAAHGLEGSR